MRWIAPALLLASLCLPALAAERLPDIPPDAMTPEQKAVAAAVAAGPRKSVPKPLRIWLRSPALADSLQKVGAYVRFKSSLPAALNEFTILLIGRHWTTPFEWGYHYPLAIKAGVSAEILDAMARGDTPEGLTPDETLVSRFTAELVRDKNVSDATYAAALKRFGERGILDMIAIAGYYGVVCMTLNVAEVPAPADYKGPPLKAAAKP